MERALELRIRVRGKHAIVKGKPSEIATFLDKIEQQSPIEQQILHALPSVEVIVQFLEEQKDFKHSLCDVMQKFLNRELNARTERKLYDNLYRRVESARKFMESKYDGKFDRMAGSQLISGKLKQIVWYVFKRNTLAEHNTTE